MSVLSMTKGIDRRPFKDICLQGFALNAIKRILSTSGIMNFELAALVLEIKLKQKNPCGSWSCSVESIGNDKRSWKIKIDRTGHKTTPKSQNRQELIRANRL
jgi:hypothetical protein